MRKYIKLFENFDSEISYEEGKSNCCNAPVITPDLCSKCGEHCGIEPANENYQDEQTRENYLIRWIDQQGYSYSVQADSFVNAEALERALKKSSEVRKVENKKIGL